MPNIAWQEPRVLIDLLALNLLAEKNKMDLPGPKILAIISPWLSDVEIEMRPGPWYQQLTVGDHEYYTSLSECLQAFRQADWEVVIAVLAYGQSPGGLYKDKEKFGPECRLLRHALNLGVKIYLVPDLHAKGIVTPLAIITGSTNLTHSGLYAQFQNANYFSHDHPEYAGNSAHLMSLFQGITPAEMI